MTEQRSYQHRPHSRSYQRWQRLWNRLTGKHTHHHLIISTRQEHWPYIKQLECVPPLRSDDYEKLLRHSESGVYWAHYVDDKWSEHEPISETVAQEILNRPELIKDRRKAFFGAK